MVETPLLNGDGLPLEALAGDLVIIVYLRRMLLLFGGVSSAHLMLPFNSTAMTQRRLGPCSLVSAFCAGLLHPEQLMALFRLCPYQESLAFARASVMGFYRPPKPC